MRVDMFSVPIFIDTIDLKKIDNLKIKRNELEESLSLYPDIFEGMNMSYKSSSLYSKLEITDIDLKLIHYWDLDDGIDIILEAADADYTLYRDVNGLSSATMLNTYHNVTMNFELLQTIGVTGESIFSWKR